VVRAVAVATQQRDKHVSTAINQHSTKEELLEAVFSTRSVPRDFITRTSANHENEHVRSIGKGKARHRKYRRLNLVVIKFTTTLYGLRYPSSYKTYMITTKWIRKPSFLLKCRMESRSGNFLRSF
jgi:hypothetical protein